MKQSESKSVEKWRRRSILKTVDGRKDGRTEGRTDGRTTDATPWHKLIGSFGPDELKTRLIMGKRNLTLTFQRITRWKKMDTTRSIHLFRARDVFCVHIIYLRPLYLKILDPPLLQAIKLHYLRVTVQSTTSMWLQENRNLHLLLKPLTLLYCRLRPWRSCPPSWPRSTCCGLAWWRDPRPCHTTPPSWKPHTSPGRGTLLSPPASHHGWNTCSIVHQAKIKRFNYHSLFKPDLII